MPSAGAGIPSVDELGMLLRRHREARGLLQEELAALVEPALSVNTIGNVERGRTRPHRHTLDMLAAALRLDADQRAELTAAWRLSRAGWVDADHLPAKTRVFDVPAHNLPVQATPLIGREQEVSAITTQLGSPDVRLLTLIGAGGIGKTRLALQAATVLLDNYADGVFCVPLAPIANPDQVISAVAQALGLPDAGGGLRDNLREFLRAMQLLLLLDNFEHLLPAATLVADLLSQAPGLKVLVTSREVLRVSGEHTFDVPPLRFPLRSATQLQEPLTDYAAVRLFVDRALAVKPDFPMTNASLSTVAEICRQLDGLPLAIELAAARVSHIAAEALLPLLERRLSVLTLGARDLPARQQTLRGAIAWSYDLLTPEEQALFRRLAVFAGGCTLEAAEAVCALESVPTVSVAAISSIQMLDRLASLIDKSLVRHTPGVSGELRYTMLETVREFGLGQLAAAGEEPAVRARHADYFEAFAERAAPHFLAAEQLVWLTRMDDELDNVRTVLAWLLQHDEHARGQLMAGSLWYFWSIHSRVTEGREWLSRLLAGSAGAAAPARARGRALLALGITAGKHYDLAACDAAYSEGLTLARCAADRWTVAMALVRWAWTMERLESWSTASHRQQPTGTALERARPGPAECYEEALAIFRELGDDWGTAVCMAFYAQFLIFTDAVRARSLTTDAVEIASRLGERFTMAFSLGQLARLAIDAGEPATARCVLEQSLALSGEINDLYSECQRLASLAQLEMDETRFAQALAWQEQRVAKYRLLGSRPQLAHALHDLAIVARRLGDFAGALQTYRESLALFQDLGEHSEAAAVKSSLGHLHVENGALAQAAATFAASLGVLGSRDNQLGMATGLAGLGGIALRTGRPTEAACLLGMAEALLDRLQTGPLDPVIRFQWSVPAYQFRRDVVHVRELRTFGRMAFEAIGAKTFAPAVAAGRALSTEAALALGLEYAERVANGAGGSVALGQVAGHHDDTAVLAWQHGRGPVRLSPREREVAVLVAQGRSNGEIGAALVIAARTADTHVGHILSKLGLHTRAQIAAWVVEHGLTNKGAG